MGFSILSKDNPTCEGSHQPILINLLSKSRPYDDDDDYDEKREEDEVASDDEMYDIDH